MVTGEDWGTWVQVSPYPLIVETSCGKQRTGCDQRRLYPERKKLAPPDPDRIHYLAAQALTILQPDLDKRGEASNLFPPHLSPAHIRSAVARYEEDIKTAGKRAVCSCCGRLLHITVIHELDQDARLRLLRSKLDLCGQHEHTWNLCSTCLTSQRRLMMNASNRERSRGIYVRRRRGKAETGMRRKQLPREGLTE